jgi:mRNA-degrading endonuclease RelE of RelBE toxin-antitoxin system
MTPASFDVRITPAFEREYRKLLKAHPDLASHYTRVIAILARDPFNRTRSHAIKKLTGEQSAGQYRIRIMRFRFIYDVDGQTVYLKYCGLRREDTYN